jgi:microcystin-dependent protein
MALQFIITDAGRAAIAQVGGAIGPVTLTKIAIGSAGYTPTASRTALQAEIKKLDPSGSSVPVPGTIHLTAQDDSAASYSVKEIGLYTNNGVLFAIYSQTGVILTKGSTASALFALDFVMTNVPPGSVTVGDAGFSYAQANETRLGVLAIATTAEAQAGTVDTKIITPLKLAHVTATESRAGVVALATAAEAQALAPDATKALTVARLVDRTATTGRVGVVALATNAQTQAGTDASRAVTPASLASAASLFVPPGAVLPFAMAVTPSGWLAANGAAVSRTTYAALFAAIGTLYGAGDGSTTFALPDLRGYFVRGSGTNSDGTAAGNFGAKQGDAFQGHIHANSGGGASGTFVSNLTDYQQSKTNALDSGSGNFIKGPINVSTGTVSWTQPAISGPSTDGTNGTPRTAAENRPKNIALLYCIKF